MSWRCRAVAASDHGSTPAEYALVIGLVAVLIVGAAAALGLGVAGLLPGPPPGCDRVSRLISWLAAASAMRSPPP